MKFLNIPSVLAFSVDPFGPIDTDVNFLKINFPHKQIQFSNALFDIALRLSATIIYLFKLTYPLKA
jgi:hypothetical protein